MWLHMADNSDERGQFRILVEEDPAAASLVSYHYMKTRTTRDAWEKFWSEQMHLHLVSWPNQKPQFDSLMAEKPGDHLMSYASEGDEAAYAPIWESDLRPRVIIDSGAFTAWSTGKPIAPEDYADWAIGFRERWAPKMRRLDFISLDVIGDQEASWRNFHRIRSMGLDVLPVVTHDAPKRDVEAALEYPYICFGGLVPLANSRGALREWLDKVFSLIVERWKQTGEMPKIHLLGVGQEWVLERYPCYSSDTSSWVRSLRFGRSDVMGRSMRRLPRYTAGEGELAVTLQTLREEIRKLKRIERDATNLWKNRGIEWKD